MGFNLRSIKQLPAAEVVIKDPADGTPTGVVFEMAGPEHPERKRIQFAQSRKTLKRFEKSGRVAMPDPEEVEEDRLRNLAAYTLGWSGYVDEDDKPIPFSREAALALYQDPAMAWLVEQLESALSDRELFIRRSATR